MLKETGIKIKNWLSYFIRIEYLLTPIALDKWYGSSENWTYEVFIFGIRIFEFRRW